MVIMHFLVCVLCMEAWVLPTVGHNDVCCSDEITHAFLSFPQFYVRKFWIFMKSPEYFSQSIVFK